MKFGKALVTVSSILLILYGAASVLAILLSLFHPEAKEYALAQHLTMDLPTLSVSVLIVKCALMLLTGAYGLFRAPSAGPAKTAYVLCIACLAAVTVDTVLTVLSSGWTGVPEVSSGLLEFLMPILLAVGVRLTTAKRGKSE